MSEHSQQHQDTRDTLLFVWDAPNLDMGLGEIVGGRPAAAHRPRFDAIGRWLLAQAGTLSHRCGTRVEAQGSIFVNVTPGGAEVVRPWVEALRNVGFAVFAKPKRTEETDVDPDMVAHIRDHLARSSDNSNNQSALRGVVIASADGQNFGEVIEQLLEQSVSVTILGFHELCPWAVNDERLTFVDLEDIPGAFREPLPRVNLDSLPDEGAWLQPFRPLSALISNKQD
ncbi:NYN domain-containing protein [Corynebacterium sp. sy039]|uniref:NYN domain-containing protein n=1 Tax=Corynebacterium sp. sy039 TaxID=2599641 RepID=UPI0011B669CF|nr:NYN domain-containing protein [Corynebacterium sp. sy039]QDZ41948.1 NYN domain-containing protein [Corynebacterium sp. sy039]